MGFHSHKISGSLVFIVICMTVTIECTVLTPSARHTVVNGCGGVPGRNGRDGRDGIQGPPGLPGNVATSTEFERKFDSLASVVEQLRKNTLEQPSTGGATYVRWGRNVCPPKTLKLYSGFVAGSYFSQSGSGANNVCLPKDPQWNRTVAGLQSGGRLYGTEFGIRESNSGFFRSNAGGKFQHNHDVQCAVCQTLGRLTQLMIPGRLERPFGWSREYLGFLMSGHYTHKRTEYVCVDQDPDVHPGTAADRDGNIFSQVEVACGSLPCPPYVDGYEVTCVVCTQ